MRKKLTRGTLLAGIAATVIAGASAIGAASAVPAQAAGGFPLVTFTIKEVGRGQCVTATTSTISPWLYSAPCSATDLSQQWTYDPLTQQLHNLGTGKCASNIDGGQARTEPCNSSDAKQKYQATPYGGHYFISTTDTTAYGWYAPAGLSDPAIRIDQDNGYYNSDLAFDFPLL